MSDLARADLAYESGDRVSAAREYATVLTTDPNNSRAIYQLARLRKREPREAVRLLRRYVTLEPADAWGYIALADALGRAGKYDEALRLYKESVRLAPGERDAVVGLARMLTNAGRTDAARVAYAHWLATNPRDAAAWRELAHLNLLAGRPRSAARALERFQALTPDPSGAKLLAAARGAAGPSFTPLARGGRDSDGNTTVRVGGAGDLSLHGPTRLGFSASRSQVGDGATTVGVQDLAVLLTTRPRAVLRFDGTAGATRIQPGVGTAGTIHPTGHVRARWHAAGARTAVDVKVQRQVLDATTAVLANRVVRTELGGTLQVPVAKAVNVRGIGRFAALNDSALTNYRTAFGGVVALAVTPSVELSGQVHSTGYAHSSAAGYVAPRRAQLVEVGSYMEFQAPRSALFACDIGAGLQRVAQQGAAVGPWHSAFRLYALISVPLAPGRDLRFEFNGDDSGSGSENETTAQWRNATAALSLRWAMR